VEISYTHKLLNPQIILDYNKQENKWYAIIEGQDKVVEVPQALLAELKKMFEAKGITVDLEK